MTKAYALPEALRRPPTEQKFASVFWLTKASNAELTRALIAYGAKAEGRGLAQKDEALLRLARGALTNLDGS